jgi:hypothetical protein
LDVNGDGLLIRGVSTSTTSSYSRFDISNGNVFSLGIIGGFGHIGTSTALEIRFVTNNVESLRLASNNNVGIGNTAPAHKLRVEGTASVLGAATFSNTVTVTGDTTFNGAIDEKVYNLTGTAIDPSNGTIQYKEIGSNVTLTDSLSEGESVTVMIKSTSPNDTVTWPTTTWVNNGKTAPTIITGDWTVVALWKVSTTLYGALVGDGS